MQIFPENNATAPPLLMGARYEYLFQMVDAPHARAYFEIRDGHAVEIAK